MFNETYGGLADPIEDEKVVESVETPEAAEVDESFVKVASEEVIPEAEVIEEIVETEEPIEFNIEHRAEPVVNDPEEPIEAIEVTEGEEATIESETKLESAIEIPRLGAVRVTTPTLNIRSGPGFTYDAVATANKDAIYDLIDEKDSWGKISDGKWISLSELFVSRI